MATKEATVFILDLGRSMGQTTNGRSESSLEWSMRYVWDKITDIVSANRATLCVGVLGLRTDQTRNKLQDDGGYENISVLQEIGPMNMASLRDLQTKIAPSNTVDGDAISAIVIGVDMIDTYTKKNKWLRKIVLVTDGQGALDGDDTSAIAKKMNESNIQLTVLGVDFDDAEFGFKEEDKGEFKTENEKILHDLAAQCEGSVVATMAEAISELDTPRVKAVKPFKSFDGFLTLGDPEKLPSAMNIRVERYFMTKLARPPAASTVIVKSESAATQSTQTLDGDAMDGVEFSAVKQARAYKVNDPDAPGGKRDVEFDSLAKGYEYGRTAVHISESEHNITKIETTKSFAIVGFLPWDRYEPFLNMGETCVTFAPNRNAAEQKSHIALSSLIWALMELESYAVARLVMKDGKEPQLVLMAPHVDNEMECLYDVPLPFAEDVRTYQFPPLDRVITVSGQTLTKHRFLPSDELTEAMSDYVDAMDLTTYGTDDNGNPAEYAPIDEVFNPSIHRVNTAVKTRAVDPDGALPKTADVLLRFAHPPQALVDKAQTRADVLAEAAEIKKVPPKAKGKYRRETVKPISGLDVDALLAEDSKSKGNKVSSENAVPDFKRILATTEQMSDIEDASKQLGNIVSTLITDSFGDSKYDQAMEALGAMREELINMEEPSFFNNFVKDMKKRLLSGALGGDRRDFWFQLRGAKLGLISSTESEVSDVSSEEAEEFYKSRSGLAVQD